MKSSPPPTLCLHSNPHLGVHHVHLGPLATTLDPCHDGHHVHHGPLVEAMRHALLLLGS